VRKFAKIRCTTCRAASFDFAAAGLRRYSVAWARSELLTPDLLQPKGTFHGECTGGGPGRRSLFVCAGHAAVHPRADAKTRAYALTIREALKWKPDGFTDSKYMTHDTGTPPERTRHSTRT